MTLEKKSLKYKSLEVQVVISQKKFFFFAFFFIKMNIFFLWKNLIASYGARVCGSVFKMKFRIFSRDFESIETSLGFAQLLGENWV